MSEVINHWCLEADHERMRADAAEARVKVLSEALDEAQWFLLAFPPPDLTSFINQRNELLAKCTSALAQGGEG